MAFASSKGSSNSSSDASRRSLFGGHKRRRSADDASLLVAATRLPQRDDTTTNADNTAATAPSSLFGAVMKHVEHPSTPKASNSSSILSPGGFQLLDFVNSVKSPFHLPLSSPSSQPASPDSAALAPEWQEVDLDKCLIDWSIKRQVHVECQPILRGWKCPTSIVQQAQHDFVRQIPAEDPLVGFHAALFSWVYPSSHPSAAAGSATPLEQSLLPDSSSTFMPPPAARPTKPQREWQQAFDSLFCQWRQQTGTYFYASGAGSTVLFRSTLDGGKHRPMIVLSSTSLSVRDRLRAMGVRLYLLSDIEDYSGEFDEQCLRRPLAAVDAASPAVEAELVALRRAQVMGQTIGADVNVKKKVPAAVLSPKRIPPLYVVGDDDCAAVAEVYRNLLGQLTGEGKFQSLPILSCRGLGPFLLASLERASVTVQRNGSVEIHGRLLPCAVREILSSVRKMVENCHEGDQGHVVVRLQANEVAEPAPTASTTIGTHHSRWMNGWRGDKNGESKTLRYGETQSIAVWDASRPKTVVYRVNHEGGNLLG